MTSKHYTAIAAAALLAASSPAWADDNADLRAEIRALSAKIEQLQAKQAQMDAKVAATQAAPAAAATAAAAPAKGSFPGSMLIPGTNTSVKLYGYAKLDVIDDLAGTDYNGTTLDFSTIPIKGTPQARRHGQLELTARQSRLGLETRTPTAYGDLSTLVEMDFLGSNSNELYTNSAAPRIRQAYGQLAGVLAGQAWTNFIDLPSTPETIDFNGPVGQENGVRQAQLRYTHSFGNAGTLSVAAENPEGDFFGADHGLLGTNSSASSSRVFDIMPDFTAHYVYARPWGRLSVAGVLRDLNLDTGGAPAVFQGANGSFTFNGKTSALGYAGALVGQFPTFGKDTVTVRVMGGPGMGRYMQNANSGSNAVVGESPNGLTNNNPGDGAVLANGSLHPVLTYGGSFAYRHYWTPTLRSTAVAGIVRRDNPNNYLPANTLVGEYSLHTNLIWSPIPQTNVGIEYIWGRASLNGQTPANKALGYGTDGYVSRVQLGFQYLF